MRKVFEDACFIFTKRFASCDNDFVALRFILSNTSLKRKG